MQKKEKQSTKAISWRNRAGNKRNVPKILHWRELWHIILLSRYGWMLCHFRVFSSTHLRALTNASIHGVTWSLVYTVLGIVAVLPREDGAFR